MTARTKHVQTSPRLARGDCASCGYPVATASVARLQADFSLLPDRLSLAMTELVTLGPSGQAALSRWGSSTSTVLETLAHVADTLSVMVVALEQPNAASAAAIDAPLAVDPALDSNDTVEVVASEGGFLPRVINVHKGEPVRLRLTTSDREHCFAIDALRVEKRIVPGKATILELTPGKAGTFPFSCCLETGAAAEKEHGRLVVVE